MRLARVRMSAEAFSYLTLRGIAGELLLKVMLLSGSIDEYDRRPPRSRSNGLHTWLAP